MLKNKRHKISLWVVIVLFLILIPCRIKLNNFVEKKAIDYSLYIQTSNFYTVQLIIDDLSSNNWTWANLSGYCTGSGIEIDPYIIQNDIFSVTTGDALVIRNSIKYVKLINCTFKDSDSAGLLLENVTNLIVFNNFAYNNYYGINIYNSNEVVVKENYIHNNYKYNLNVDNSNNIEISLNNITGNNLNQDQGLRLYYSQFDDIYKNNISNSYVDIMLDHSDYNEIFENNISLGGGVSLFVSDNSNLYNNYINNSRWGIKLNAGDYNMVSNNFIDNIESSGIAVSDAVNNVIFNNSINNSAGVYCGGSNYNQINNNIIVNSQYDSLKVVDAEYNIISNNNIYNGIENGIRVDYGSHRNNFTNNVIQNTCKKGFMIFDDCHYNYIFNNSFVNNTLNAEDNCTDNYWDNGNIGNFWDDYLGFDIDDNGIGDSPYYVSGLASSQDNYPICDDGDDVAPIINIISPFNNSRFTSAPLIQIGLYDYYSINSTWYKIESYDQVYLFTGNTIYISDSIWNTLPESLITFLIYANDTAGNTNCIELIITKDHIEDLSIPFGNWFLLSIFIYVIGLLILHKKKYIRVRQAPH